MVGEPDVPLLDIGNIVVLGVKVLQVVHLIRKVVKSVEPQVGQWVGSGWVLLLVIQIDLGLVVVEEVGLG